MNEFENACTLAGEAGHRLEDDAVRSRPSSMRRKTCTVCERSVVGNERVSYGSATEGVCPIATAKTEPPLAPVHHPAVPHLPSAIAILENALKCQLPITLQHDQVRAIVEWLRAVP